MDYLKGLAHALAGVSSATDSGQWTLIIVIIAVTATALLSLANGRCMNGNRPVARQFQRGKFLRVSGSGEVPAPALLRRYGKLPRRYLALPEDGGLDETTAEAVVDLEAIGKIPIPGVDQEELRATLRKTLDEEFAKAEAQIRAEGNKLKDEQERELRAAKEKYVRASAALVEAETLNVTRRAAELSKFAGKVDDARVDVEQAMKELEMNQQLLRNDPLLRVGRFQTAGVARQSALTMGVLLFIRGLGDLPAGDLWSGLVQIGLGTMVGALFFVGEDDLGE